MSNIFNWFSGKTACILIKDKLKQGWFDLTHLEINTIVKSDMTASKIISSPRMLVHEIAVTYHKELEFLGKKYSDYHEKDGSLFRGDAEENNKRARLAIRYILHSNTVIPIPGMNRIHDVDNVVKAVIERRTLDTKEQAELEEAGKDMWAALPPHYQWLKDWEYV